MRRNLAVGNARKRCRASGQMMTSPDDKDESPTGTEARLVSVLTSLQLQHKADAEKVRGIFDWIAANLRYDIDAFRQGQRRGQGAQSATKESALTTLGRGKATCVGFSDLFSELCSDAGVQCVKIKGYAKGLDYVPGMPFQSPNHEWNAVFLDGSWHLVDVCWGSGFVTESAGDYRSHAEHHFLFTDPREFVRDHLPVDDRWQLLSREQTVSKASFELQPHFRPGYFINCIRSDRESEGVLEASGCAPIDVNLSLQAPMLITYRLQRATTGECCSTFVSYAFTARRAHFRVHLPTADNYLFTIYGGRNDIARMSPRGLVSYTLRSKSQWEIPPSLRLPRDILWGPTRAFQDCSLRAKSFSSVLPIDDTRGSCHLTFQCMSRGVSFKGLLRTLIGKDEDAHGECVVCERREDEVTVTVRPPGFGCYRLAVLARLPKPATSYSIVCNCLVVYHEPGGRRGGDGHDVLMPLQNEM